jgi:hypothetical protein
MMRVNMTKAEFMHAYASQYYDPVKAHEYYERTKQLKGRSTSGMSDEQKKTWGYVKNEIMTDKKKQSDANKADQAVAIEQLRSEASVARERISAKLKAYIESISDQASSDRETLSESAQKQKEQLQAERQSKIDALPAIPTTASAAQKSRMRAANAQKTAQINNEYKEKIAAVTEKAQSQRSDISEKASDDKSGARDSAGQERKAVATNLKTAISTVRAKVKEIQEALASATEETLDQEYDNIMKNIAGKAATSKSGSKKSGSGDDAKRQKFIADNLAKLKSK